MAQVTIGKTKPVAVKETVLPESYQHSIIESRYIPHTSMLSQVPGQPTLCEYYRGSYGRDEEQHGFQPESIETYQSYKRVHNLIYKQDSGNGNFNFNPENRESEHTIAGYLLFDLTPNIGDLLIKDIGDGRAGLYVLHNQPEIRTIAADKCYYFEATLTAIVNKAIMDNLNSKVIEELYYSKDSHIGGGNAVLTASDNSLNKKLYDLQAGIIDDILANHYYADESTIVIPNDGLENPGANTIDPNNTDALLYDPYLAKFLGYVFPPKMMGPRRRIEVINPNYYSNDMKMQEPLTIWDMFYRQAFDSPKRFQQKYFTHNRHSMINTRQYGGFFFSKMDFCITVHKEGAYRNPYLFSGAMLPNGVPIAGVAPTGEGTPWDYFFGDDFYEGGGTEVQQFIWKMFRDKTVDKQQLVDTLSKFWDLDEVTKLYMSGIYVGASKIGLLKSSSYT